MTIKDVLDKFDKDESEHSSIVAQRENDAQIWLNNSGKQLLWAFKSEVNKIKPWQCDLEFEEFGQHTGRRYARIHVYQGGFSVRSGKWVKNKNVYIAIRHEKKDDAQFTITLSDGQKSLEPFRAGVEDITMAFLGDQLDRVLREFYLDKIDD